MISSHINTQSDFDDDYLFHGYMESSLCDFGLLNLLCILQLNNDDAIILMHTLRSSSPSWMEVVGGATTPKYLIFAPWKFTLLLCIYLLPT